MLLYRYTRQHITKTTCTRQTLTHACAIAPQPFLDVKIKYRVTININDV